MKECRKNEFVGQDNFNKRKVAKPEVLLALLLFLFLPFHSISQRTATIYDAYNIAQGDTARFLVTLKGFERKVSCFQWTIRYVSGDMTFENLKTNPAIDGFVFNDSYSDRLTFVVVPNNYFDAMSEVTICTLNFLYHGTDSTSIWWNDNPTPRYVYDEDIEEYPLVSYINGKAYSMKPLPIELLDFSANCDEGAVTLQWSTATETNNDYFEIEKSADCQNWNALTRIAGAGNSNCLLNYQYVDFTPNSGISYYRLKQYDFDGQSSVSGVLPVSCGVNEISANAKVYPNPAVDYASIQLYSFKDAEVKIMLLDAAGTNLRPPVTSLLMAGENTIRIDKLPTESKLIFVKIKSTQGAEITIPLVVGQ